MLKNIADMPAAPDAMPDLTTIALINISSGTIDGALEIEAVERPEFVLSGNLGLKVSMIETPENGFQSVIFLDGETIATIRDRSAAHPDVFTRMDKEDAREVGIAMLLASHHIAYVDAELPAANSTVANDRRRIEAQIAAKPVEITSPVVEIVTVEAEGEEPANAA